MSLYYVIHPFNKKNILFFSHFTWYQSHGRHGLRFSISKLIRDLNCLITFFDNSITLHNRSRRTIDIGRKSQGLFHLSSPSPSIACTSMDTSLLIHSRLGHPNISKFRIMVPRFSSLSSIECESC